MKLIVGLGNPGLQYQTTRHNLGQQIIINYVRAIHESPLQNKPKLSAQIYECPNKNFFAITNEYMNNSGVAVQKILNFYKISPQDLYVIHDDLDLPVGEYRIQFDRGSAGHNGIKSIIENTGTQAFHRIRVGIGKPINNIPVEDYVLQPFTKEEKEKINSIVPQIIEEIKMGL